MSNRIENINPERLLWCLESAGMHPEDYHKIKPEKIREGNLTYRQLNEFAKYFGYSLFFFLESDTPKPTNIHSLEFRTLQNQQIPFDVKTGKLIKHIENSRHNLLAVMEDLLEEPEPFAPPELKGNRREKAKAVRQWLGLDLSENNTFTTYREKIEAKNILVFQSMGFRGKWKVENKELIGLSIPYPVFPIIFVLKFTDTPERQTFTLFHELAHILLHDEALIDNHDNLKLSSKEKEREANRFAGLCLVPDSLLENIEIPENVEDYRSKFRAIKEKTGVSTEVIVRRLLDTGKLTRETYTKYINFTEQQYQDEQKSRSPQSIPRIFRYREPLHIFGRNYTGKILEGLENGVVTLKKAGHYLDTIKVVDIRKLEKGFYEKT